MAFNIFPEDNPKKFKYNTIVTKIKTPNLKIYTLTQGHIELQVTLDFFRQHFCSIQGLADSYPNIDHRITKISKIKIE